MRYLNVFICFSVAKDCINSSHTQLVGIERGRGHPKCVQLRVGTGGVTPDVYVRSYIVSCFICRNLMPIALAKSRSA